MIVKKKKKKVSKYKGSFGVSDKIAKSTVTKKKLKKNDPKRAHTEGGANIATKPSGYTYSGASSLRNAGGRNAGTKKKPVNALGKKYGGKSPFKNIGASGKIKGPTGNIDPKTGRKRVVKKKSTRNRTRNFV